MAKHQITIERSTDETATMDLCRIIVWFKDEDGCMSIQDIGEMDNAYGNAAARLMRIFSYVSAENVVWDPKHSAVDLGRSKLPATIAQRIFDTLEKKTYDAQDAI